MTQTSILLRPVLGPLLSSDRILLWSTPLTQRELLRQLLQTIRASTSLDTELAFQKLLAREAEGSTFLNEGIAFPHCQVPGLSRPEVALGLPRAGVKFLPTKLPTEVVFLVLSPNANASTQLPVMAQAARLFKDPSMRTALASAQTGSSVLEIVRQWEQRVQDVGYTPRAPRF